MSWAEIKHALNSTLGLSSFAPLDKMIQGGVQEFTDDGTFTVPKGVTRIWITACAGGKAGQYSSSSNGFQKGGQGGEYVYKKAYSVTPAQSIDITVGKGGTTSMKEGTNTVIGDLVTLLGGGVSGSSGAHPGSVALFISSESSGSSKDRYYLIKDGASTQTGIGGVSSPGDSYYDDGIGGGGASLGNGASEYFETAAGYGGGGAGGNASSTNVLGGGDGIVIIEW